MSATAPITVLTVYEGDEDIYQTLSAGAKGDLLRDMMRAVRRGMLHLR